MTCFDDGVLNEGGAGFRYIGDIEFGLRNDFYAGAGKQFIDFANLAGISAGEYDFFLWVSSLCRSRFFVL